MESILKKEQWNTGFIFIAALAERFRKDIGISDLSNEQLIAGLFHLRCLHVEQRAGVTGLEKFVRTEIQNRGLWLNTLRQYLEPQLKANLDNINSFDSFINDIETLNTAADLLLEWLTTIQNLSVGIKIQIIDSLLLSNKKDALGKMVLCEKDITDIEMKRTWNVVGFITNYEATKTLLEKDVIEPELLWHIRGRTSDRYGDNLKVQLLPEQIKWIIKKFRSAWPLIDRPRGMMIGDRNSWDASQYLIDLIRQLGNSIDQQSINALNNLNLRLPIEVKGQWHPDLWHAADSQLDRLYTQDWQADKRGIYLILWFGKQTNKNKKLKGLGRGISLPKSPEELRTMLIEKSTAAREKRIEIVVMDVSRN